jgi:prepilin-type N-terminal cleavage/methylation domain-containing protein
MDRPARGVTLIELMIVLLILAMVSATALPRFAHVRRQHRFDLVSRRLVADLRKTRAQAIRAKANYTVLFTPLLQRYEMFRGTLQEPTTQDLATVQLDETPYKGIRLIDADFAGAQGVTFNRLGLPSAAGTVILNDGWHEATITVSASTGLAARTTGVVVSGS